MKKVFRALMFVSVLAMSGAVFAQDAPAPGLEPFPWQTALAGLINGLGVMVAVWGINRLVPVIRDRAPFLIPIMAGSLGPAVATLQNYLAAWLGQPIDLDPLLAIFSGATGVAIHQVYKQSTHDPKDKHIRHLEAALRRATRRRD